MRKLLARWLNRRVVIRPACFEDRRPQYEIDAELQRRFEAGLKQNLLRRQERERRDPTFVPPYLEAETT